MATGLNAAERRARPGAQTGRCSSSSGLAFTEIWQVVARDGQLDPDKISDHVLNCADSERVRYHLPKLRLLRLLTPRMSAPHPRRTSPSRQPTESVVRFPSRGTEGAHYALSIIRKAGISTGQDVLVNGATGAIGSAAVQLLADLDVRMTAVCGPAHVELVRGLGADRVIDRDAVDFTKDDHQYDVVFDAVGKSSIGRCRSLLRLRGLFLTTDLGPWSQNAFLPMVTGLSRGRRVMLPTPIENQEIVEYLGERIASGRFRPLVDRRYPFEQIVEAYRYVETGQTIGNVIITVEPPG